MPRPKKNRAINCNPEAYYFKPRGVPLRQLESIYLLTDELEAINLADKKLCSHEEAAQKMKISRATFGRILRSARSKIAEAIISGKAIEIQK